MACGKKHRATVKKGRINGTKEAPKKKGTVKKGK